MADRDPLLPPPDDPTLVVVPEESGYFQRRHLIAFFLLILLVTIGSYWSTLISQFAGEYIFHEEKPTLAHGFAIAVIASLIFIFLVEWLRIPPIITV